MSVRSRAVKIGSAFILSGAFVVTGCTGGFDDDSDVNDDNGEGGAGEADSGDSINVALNGEPSTLDPLYDIGIPAVSVFRSVFSALTVIDENGEVGPGLAESWDTDETAETWTFVLRDDATFHNGEPVTAEDVVFSYEQGLERDDAAIGSYVSSIGAVEATGEFEVTFTMDAPYAAFDRQATLISILPQDVYEEDPEGFANDPVGSGPYVVENWNGGDGLSLSQYGDYHGDHGPYSEVEIRFITDESTRANSLQAGDLDIAQLGVANVDTLRDTEGVEVMEQESNRVLYLGFNVEGGPLADPQVREAIDLALDRGAISSDLYQGLAEPTGQMVAPTVFGYNDDILPTDYDADSSAELLEDAGYDGTPIVLSYPATELPQVSQLAQTVGGYLEEAGLTIELDQQETGNFRSAWLNNELPGIYIWQFAPSIMDADLPLSLLAAPDSTRYFNDDQIDDLMVEQIATVDAEERAELLGQILQVINDESYYAPLFTDVYTFGASEGTDWEPRPDGLFIFD